MTAPSRTVRALTPADWERYRAVRLAALTEAPDAFGSTLDRERAFTVEQWRARLARPGQFLAERDGAACGLVGGVPVPDVAGSGATGVVELVSLWVHPSSRGLGVGDALVRTVLDWSAEQAARRVTLWVAEGNLLAERLYARHGFRRTGRVQPFGGGRPGREFAMARPVTPPPG